MNPFRRRIQTAMQSGGGAAAFSPTDIAGLKLWLDASQITGLNAGDAITTWSDLTGNGWNATQATASKKPTYQVVSGLPVVQTDGIDDFLSTIGPNLSAGDYTVVCGSRYVVAAGGGRVLSGIPTNWLLGHFQGTTENYYAGGFVAPAGSGPADTNWRIYAGTGEFVADSWALYVNGALTAGPNANGVSGPLGLCVGCYGGGSEFSNAQVSFVFVYDRVLTGAEILTIYNGMRGRLGL